MTVRTRRASICSYCRSDVDRGPIVGCVRRGCGARYHRECWEECSLHYGRCAVFGCRGLETLEEPSPRSHPWRLVVINLTPLFAILGGVLLGGLVLALYVYTARARPSFDPLVILVIALLIFGRRLPFVMRSLGNGIVEFRRGLHPE